LIGVLAMFCFWPGSGRLRAATGGGAHLNFGPAEQAYAREIQFENIALRRAENFLHQEVTTLSGAVANQGSQPLANLELTIEFFDGLHQIALRETRSALESSTSPLEPGEHRTFEVSFERLSSSWNMQPPAVHVTGLQFARASR
jgi:hypothetical protein